MRALILITRVTTELGPRTSIRSRLSHEVAALLAREAEARGEYALVLEERENYSLAYHLAVHKRRREFGGRL